MKLVCVISSSALDLFILVELLLQCRGGGINPGKISRTPVGGGGGALNSRRGYLIFRLSEGAGSHFRGRKALAYVVLFDVLVVH